MRAAWDKMIVALDSDNPRVIRRVVRALAPKVKIFKVGLIPYTLCGPGLIRWIHAQNAKVFLDLKLFDIPNTMVGAARLAARMGVWAFTVHIQAGPEALRNVKEATRVAFSSRLKPPLVIGVTHLTSRKTSSKNVLARASQGVDAGIDGVVCSVHEAAAIKKSFKRLCVITPGIRSGRAHDDQKRVATVADAIRNNADYFVVGRPILRADDYLQAARELMKG